MDLHTHLADLGYKYTESLWGWYKQLFTGILAKENWLALIDFLVTNPEDPQFMIFFPAAYLLYFKSPLMRINDSDTLRIFLQKQNPCDISTIIKRMKKYRKKYTNENLRVSFAMGLPLREGGYQEFSEFPKETVRYYQSLQ